MKPLKEQKLQKKPKKPKPNMILDVLVRSCAVVKNIRLGKK